MTVIRLDQEDLNVRNLILNNPILQSEVNLGFESLFALYHGLATTPKRHFKHPSVQQSVRQLANNIAQVADVSLEGVDLDFTTFGMVSNENAFTDGVRKVIDTLLDWLSKVKAWFIKLFKLMFDVKQQETKRNTQTKEDFKQANKAATPDNPLPKKIECQLPGTCLLIFHWRKFDPTSKLEYTDKAIEVSIEHIGKEFDTLLSRYSGSVAKALKAIDPLVDEINQPIPSINSDTVWDVVKDGVLRDYYRNHFECMGFGLSEKPLRNYNRAVSKYQLTNTVSKHGWDQLDQVKLRIDVDNFEALNTLVGKTTGDMLAKIADLTEQISKSKAFDRLTQLKKKVNEQLDNMRIRGISEDSNDYVLVESMIRRINVIYEILSLMSDNVQLLGMFYARYTSTLNGILSGVATRLKDQQTNT